MTRIFSSGLELGDLAMEFDTVTGSPTAATNIVRSGTYSLRCNVSAASAYVIHDMANDGASGQTRYMRFYLYIASLPAATMTIAELFFNAGAGTQIRLTSGGVLQLFNKDGDAQIGSDSSALSTATWYRVEFSASWTDNSCTARVDGSEFASGDGAVDWTDFRLGAGITGTGTADLYFDDVAINSQAGAAQNSFPGAGQIVHMLPDSAGDDAPDGSGSFADVDEVPPSDAEFYVHAAANDICDVNCQTSASAGIGASDTITLVAVGARVAAATATNCSWNPRIKSQASGTTVNGTTTTIASTTFNTHDDTAGSRQYKLVQLTDPQAGGSWTPALLDTMQIGTRAPDATPDVSVSALWALVEAASLNPGGGGTVRPRSLLTLGVGS